MAKSKSYRSEHAAVAALVKLGYSYSSHLIEWPEYTLNSRLGPKTKPGRRSYPKLTGKLVDELVTELQQTCWHNDKDEAALLCEGGNRRWFTEFLD